MAQTYKRRRNAFEGEANRDEAVRRLKNEHSVRQKMHRLAQPISKNRPEEQLAAARNMQGQRREARDVQARARTHMTTRGKRRLSFREAYSRRTTDSSRARVLNLYGRSKPPSARARIETGGGYRMPNEGPSTGGARYKPRGTGDQGAGLNRVAQMRSRAQKQMDYLPRRRKSGSRPGGLRHVGTGRRRYLL